MGTDPMLSYERQREMLKHMRLRGAGKVNELAEAIGVSPSTIRRDLREMDELGLVTRVHGGASLPESDNESVLSARAADHEAEKRAIGAAAAELIEDDSTVMITGGTTTQAILPHLQGRSGLTVVTNGLNIALELSRIPGITVVVLGGILRPGELSLLGPLGERTLDEFEISQAFVGAYGIDPVTGLSGASVHEASTDRRLLRGLARIVVVVDSSKFFQRGPVRLASTDQLAVVITDTGAPPASLDVLRELGVEVRAV